MDCRVAGVGNIGQQMDNRMKKVHLWTLIAVAVLSGIAWIALSSQPENKREESAPETAPVAASPPKKQTNATTLLASRPTIEHRDGYLG